MPSRIGVLVKVAPLLVVASVKLALAPLRLLLVVSDSQLLLLVDSELLPLVALEDSELPPLHPLQVALVDSELLLLHPLQVALVVSELPPLHLVLSELLLLHPLQVALVDSELLLLHPLQVALVALVALEAPLSPLVKSLSHQLVSVHRLLLLHPHRELLVWEGEGSVRLPLPRRWEPSAPRLPSA
jgi:hypothetical protein